MSVNPVTQPQDIAARFVEAWNRKDARAIADLFTENADFVNVVGIWWQNSEEIYKAHEYGLRVIFPQSTLRLGKVKVKMLQPEIAIIHARMSLVGQTEKNGEAAQRQNLFLFVARKNGGEWLCESAQNTDIVIGAETNIRNADGHLQPVNYRK